MNAIYEPKKDCFGWDKTRNRCTVLRETYCKIEQCGFYKKKGTLCNGCPDKGTGSCANCRESRKGMR